MQEQQGATPATTAAIAAAAAAVSSVVCSQVARVAAAAHTHHIGFLLLILMQTFTSGGQGWASLKKPSKAGKPLNSVVGRLPLHSGMKLEAALAAVRSALLVKSVTSMFFCRG